MKLTSKAAKITAVVALSVGATVFGSGAAFAGSNGQQLEFVDFQHDTNSIVVEGWNQNGDYARGCFQTPTGTTYIGGWWWVGNISWQGYSDSNCGASGGYQTTQIMENSVPQSQSGDWFAIAD